MLRVLSGDPAKSLFVLEDCISSGDVAACHLSPHHEAMAKAVIGRRPLVPCEPFCHHTSLAPVFARVLRNVEDGPRRARLAERSDRGVAQMEDEGALTLFRLLTRQGPSSGFEVDLLPAGLARLLRPCRS